MIRIPDLLVGVCIVAVIIGAFIQPMSMLGYNYITPEQTQQLQTQSNNFDFSENTTSPFAIDVKNKVKEMGDKAGEGDLLGVSLAGFDFLTVGIMFIGAQFFTSIGSIVTIITIISGIGASIFSSIPVLATFIDYALRIIIAFVSIKLIFAVLKYMKNGDDLI